MASIRTFQSCWNFVSLVSARYFSGTGTWRSDQSRSLQHRSSSGSVDSSSRYFAANSDRFHFCAIVYWYNANNRPPAVTRAPTSWSANLTSKIAAVADHVRAVKNAAAQVAGHLDALAQQPFECLSALLPHEFDGGLLVHLPAHQLDGAAVVDLEEKTIVRGGLTQRLIGIRVYDDTFDRGIGHVPPLWS